jgi:fructokinase
MTGDPRGGPRAPFAGVELGGTKCVCTLAFGPGEVLDQQVVSTTAPDETLPAIRAILESWKAAHGIAALGIASFGPIDLQPASPRYGHVLATNKPGWPGADVLGRLGRDLGVPVGFDTDVNGAAMAEIRWGSAQGLSDFAYVTVGTGIGVGLVVHGRPTRGIGHSEIGHIRLPRSPGDLVPSACRYHDDCVEGLASGSAVRLRLDGRTIEAVTPDDPFWQPIVHALAAMCHALVATTGPQRIAIGGGVLARQPHLIARIEAALVESLAGYMPIPSNYVVAPRLAEMVGPLGSIALAADAAQAHGEDAKAWTETR